MANLWEGTKATTWIVDGVRVRKDSEHDGTPLCIPDWMSNDYGAHEGEQRCVFIDSGIAAVVQDFWDNGIATYASCEGDPPGMAREPVVLAWEKPHNGPWSHWTRWGGEPAYCMVAEKRRGEAVRILEAYGCEVTESAHARDEWGILRWLRPV